MRKAEDPSPAGCPRRHDEYTPVTWTAGRVNNANVNRQGATNVIRIRQYVTFAQPDF